MKLLFILITIPTILFGQEQRFFTKHFQNITDEKTTNIRSYTFENDVAIITDLTQDTVVHRLTIYGITDINKVNEFAWYCLQRGVELNYREYFKNLKAILESYEGGKIREQIITRGKEYKYGQVWSRDGDKILVNGNGFNTYVSDDKSETYYENYKDSVRVLKYGIRTIERDTIHYTVDKIATPKEGFREFLQNLVNVLKYPGIAQRVGKEGRVYVQFIVDKNGKLTDFKPLSKEGYNFEEEAIKKLEKLPPWNPAIYKNNPVKQKFVLPVKFKLT